LLLPINRWNSAASNLTIGGTSIISAVTNVASTGLTTIAILLFTLASFTWSLIYDVMQFALTHDLIQSASQQINAGFQAIGTGILAPGLVVVLIFFVIFSIAMSVLKGNNKFKLVSTLLALIIPIAAIQALTTLASSGSASGTVPTGSPAWIASKGLGMADAISSGFASEVSSVTPTMGSQALSDSSDPSCEAYVETLYADYDAATKATAAQATTVGGLPSTEGTTTMSAISALWETGYLDDWMTAEFSNSINGERLYCHYLDANSVTQDEQQQIDEQAYGAGLGVTGASSASTLPTLSIDPNSIDPNQDAMLYGWAACHNVGGNSWTLWPSWLALGDADTGWNDHGSAGDQQCADWANSGAYNDTSGWPPSSGYDSFTFNSTGTTISDYGKSTPQGAALPAEQTALAYNGANAGARVLGGLTALVTALAYAWALMGLGVGSIIAQLGLIAMMILLPGTLFLLAMPRKKNKDGAVSHNLGSKLLRLTAGFFACRLIVTVVLTVLVYLTLILSSIVNTIH
jgi:hypothetical protein